jgi:hypothetical protein
VVVVLGAVRNGIQAPRHLQPHSDGVGGDQKNQKKLLLALMTALRPDGAVWLQTARLLIQQMPPHHTPARRPGRIRCPLLICSASFKIGFKVLGLPEPGLGW